MTTEKVDVDFSLTELSATKIMMWNCQVDKFTTDRYNIILCRDLLTALGLDLKFSENFIIDSDGKYEGCSSPMVDFKNY